MKDIKVCIIGAENWGSAVATAVGANVKLSSHFHKIVHMYVFDELVSCNTLSEVINETHENIKYLPGIHLPDNVVAISDLLVAAKNADVLVFAAAPEFIKSYCNLLSGNIKPDAIAVSMVKGLERIKDGEIDLFSHAISKQLGVPCYALLCANCAMEMAQGKLCEMTIGCNFEKHAKMLRELFETKNCKVMVTDDIDGVELCGALKDIISLGAGVIDGLRLGENAKVAMLHLGLKEMMRFVKSFYPNTKLSTFFESCGVAGLVASCFGDKNVKFAKSFVTTGKTIKELEVNCLNGRKLLGPVTAEEVHSFLTKENKEEMFPLFTIIHKICQNEEPPESIIESIRDHPDLCQLTISRLLNTELSNDNITRTRIVNPAPSDGIWNQTYKQIPGGIEYFAHRSPCVDKPIWFDEGNLAEKKLLEELMAKTTNESNKSMLLKKSNSHIPVRQKRNTVALGKSQQTVVSSKRMGILRPKHYDIWMNDTSNKRADEQQRTKTKQGKKFYVYNKEDKYDISDSGTLDEEEAVRLADNKRLDGNNSLKFRKSSEQMAIGYEPIYPSRMHQREGQKSNFNSLRTQMSMNDNQGNQHRNGLGLVKLLENFGSTTTSAYKHDQEYKSLEVRVINEAEKIRKTAAEQITNYDNREKSPLVELMKYERDEESSFESNANMESEEDEEEEEEEEKPTEKLKMDKAKNEEERNLIKMKAKEDSESAVEVLSSKQYNPADAIGLSLPNKTEVLIDFKFDNLQDKSPLLEMRLKEFDGLNANERSEINLSELTGNRHHDHSTVAVSKRTNDPFYELNQCIKGNITSSNDKFQTTKPTTEKDSHGFTVLYPNEDDNLEGEKESDMKTNFEPVSINFYFKSKSKTKLSNPNESNEIEQNKKKTVLYESEENINIPILAHNTNFHQIQSKRKYIQQNLQQENISEETNKFESKSYSENKKIQINHDDISEKNIQNIERNEEPNQANQAIPEIQITSINPENLHISDKSPHKASVIQKNEETENQPKEGESEFKNLETNELDLDPYICGNSSDLTNSTATLEIEQGKTQVVIETKCTNDVWKNLMKSTKTATSDSKNHNEEAQSNDSPLTKELVGIEFSTIQPNGENWSLILQNEKKIQRLKEQIDSQKRIDLADIQESQLTKDIQHMSNENIEQVDDPKSSSESKVIYSEEVDETKISLDEDKKIENEKNSINRQFDLADIQELQLPKDIQHMSNENIEQVDDPKSSSELKVIYSEEVDESKISLAEDKKIENEKNSINRQFDLADIQELQLPKDIQHMSDENIEQVDDPKSSSELKVIYSEEVDEAKISLAEDKKIENEKNSYNTQFDLADIQESQLPKDIQHMSDENIEQVDDPKSSSELKVIYSEEVDETKISLAEDKKIENEKNSNNTQFDQKYEATYFEEIENPEISEPNDSKDSELQKFDSIEENSKSVKMSEYKKSNENHDLNIGDEYGNQWKKLKSLEDSTNTLPETQHLEFDEYKMNTQSWIDSMKIQETAFPFNDESKKFKFRKENKKLEDFHYFKKITDSEFDFDDEDHSLSRNWAGYQKFEEPEITFIEETKTPNWSDGINESGHIVNILSFQNDGSVSKEESKDYKLGNEVKEEVWSDSNKDKEINFKEESENFKFSDLDRNNNWGITKKEFDFGFREDPIEVKLKDYEYWKDSNESKERKLNFKKETYDFKFDDENKSDENWSDLKDNDEATQEYQSELQFDDDRESWNSIKMDTNSKLPSNEIDLVPESVDNKKIESESASWSIFKKLKDINDEMDVSEQTFKNYKDDSLLSKEQINEMEELWYKLEKVENMEEDSDTYAINEHKELELLKELEELEAETSMNIEGENDEKLNEILKGGKGRTSKFSEFYDEDEKYSPVYNRVSYQDIETEPDYLGEDEEIKFSDVKDMDKLDYHDIDTTEGQNLLRGLKDESRLEESDLEDGIYEFNYNKNESDKIKLSSLKDSKYDEMEDSDYSLIKTKTTEGDSYAGDTLLNVSASASDIEQDLNIGYPIDLETNQDPEREWLTALYEPETEKDELPRKDSTLNELKSLNDACALSLEERNNQFKESMVIEPTEESSYEVDHSNPNIVIYKNRDLDEPSIVEIFESDHEKPIKFLVSENDKVAKIFKCEDSKVEVPDYIDNAVNENQVHLINLLDKPKLDNKKSISYEPVYDKTKKKSELIEHATGDFDENLHDYVVPEKKKDRKSENHAKKLSETSIPIQKKELNDLTRISEVTQKLKDIMERTHKIRQSAETISNTKYSGPSPYEQRLAPRVPNTDLGEKTMKGDGSIKKDLVKPFNPPLNPRVRVPRPPFDGRDHEYHTMATARNDSCPSVAIGRNHHSYISCAKTACPTMSRKPILQLLRLSRASKILCALNIGLFAALVAKYRSIKK